MFYVKFLRKVVPIIFPKPPYGRPTIDQNLPKNVYNLIDLDIFVFYGNDTRHIGFRGRRKRV